MLKKYQHTLFSLSFIGIIAFSGYHIQNTFFFNYAVFNYYPLIANDNLSFSYRFYQYVLPATPFILLVIYAVIGMVKEKLRDPIFQFYFLLSGTIIVLINTFDTITTFLFSLEYFRTYIEEMRFIDSVIAIYKYMKFNQIIFSVILVISISSILTSGLSQLKKSNLAMMTTTLMIAFQMYFISGGAILMSGILDFSRTELNLPWLIPLLFLSLSLVLSILLQFKSIEKLIAFKIIFFVSYGLSSFFLIQFFIFNLRDYIDVFTDSVRLFIRFSLPLLELTLVSIIPIILITYTSLKTKDVIVSETK
jgi:hypothetical protein